jgi:hypothetical protein
MPRQVSSAALQALLAESTNQVFLVTLELTGTGISTPIRVVNDNIDLIVSGVTYSAFPFQITLPSDDPDKPPVAKLSISNVTQLIIDELRALPTPPQVEIAIRMASSPAVVEYGPWQLDAASMSYDMNVIDIDLRMRDFTVEPFPYLRMTPSYFPALFRT